MAKIIALDLGSKTCGIAQSDPQGKIALALTTLRFDSEDYEGAIDLVKELANELQPETIVVGYPKLLSGAIGERGRISEIFANILKEELPMEIVLWDERLTTVSAERMLIGADVSRKKRKEVIDKIAATYILQSYLDTMNNRSENHD